MANIIFALVVGYSTMYIGMQFILTSKGKIKPEKEINKKVYFIFGAIGFIGGLIIFVFFIIILVGTLRMPA